VETAFETPLYASPSCASECKAESRSVRGCLASAEVIPQSRLERIKLTEFLDAAERYRPQFIWIAAKITGGSEEAEDIVQQALFKAFRKLSGFRGDSQMRTWLNAIVKNTAREYLRSPRARTFVPLDGSHPDGDSEDLDIPDRGMNPEERYQLYERDQLVFDAIGGIGHANRRVLEMCVFEERPYPEVAIALDISLSTVKSRMFRSRRDLRMAIASRVGSLR
jgi:RNA polymerase sigma-70 factor (ECF subfamily)